MSTEQKADSAVKKLSLSERLKLRAEKRNKASIAKPKRFRLKAETA